MKSIFRILVAINLLLSITTSNAQIKNQKVEQVKVFGNCEMCKEKIEKAGNVKKLSKVDWNSITGMATLNYDSKKTNADEILKRIAAVGYDNEKFLAPDTAYKNLPNCCQYSRVSKTETNQTIKMEISGNNKVDLTQNMNQLEIVYENYFGIKDALVKSDGNTASEIATTLLSSINLIKMENLKPDEHIVWMKVLNNIKEDTQHIADTKDPKHQRDYFDILSKNIYDLIKVSKTVKPTYYQFCPMANGGKGANWLSKDNAIKNPYYGSMMLSCGKTVETIKK
ncbi:DUF3347 domain-containing protein [Flavobacterium sp.]|uniref:DUF3347 domain-containing protein n=1 Tax=Flavobacterium sp. TaxID=239 RepID=UPI00286C7A03|nr:DUF3347 domain-containing protein [Flavobacterium sp.]